jgi:FKBP-type peptidyl-prolyl cis-trans isomerase
MRRYLGILTAALLAGLLLIACGDGDDDEEAAPGATPAVTAATEAGVEGGPPSVSGEVTVTESGLQIIDIEVGSGDEAAAGQVVSVHYTGWLADGTKFDSSVDRGQPFSFSLGAGQVIAGWDEGVAGIKVDGKRRLIIPPDLAYGPQGSPPTIPPNAELTFDVELLDIQQP